MVLLVLEVSYYLLGIVHHLMGILDRLAARKSKRRKKEDADE